MPAVVGGKAVVGQAFQPAGSPDFPVRCAPSQATGKSPAPADRNVRPTLDSTPKQAEARAPTECHPLALPFVGRSKEAAQLERLHAQRGHALILGPAGVGKTELIRHLASRLPVLVCPQSVRLAEICGALENQLGLDAGGLTLVPRKNRVLRALAGSKRTVVLDGLGWTTPKLSSFLECVMARVPVWIATRSDHSWDIGHVWPLLGRVERVELPPFHPAETHACVAAAVEAGRIPREALGIVEWLHRHSGGVPLVPRELLEELATHRYDLANPRALRRVDLDRRIHKLFPTTLMAE
jgi:hypothetical protein